MHISVVNLRSKMVALFCSQYQTVPPSLRSGKDPVEVQERCSVNSLAVAAIVVLTLHVGIWLPGCPNAFRICGFK